MEKIKSFLIELYSKEYFIYILIGTIIFLIILFLIVLFFGKKDEKKRKLEETTKLEREQLNAFKETSAPVNVEVSPTPAVAPVVEVPQPVNPVINNVAPTPVPTPIIEPVREIMPTPVVAPVNNYESERANNININKPVEPIHMDVNINKPVEPIHMDVNINEPIKPISLGGTVNNIDNGYQAKPIEQVAETSKEPVNSSLEFNFDELASSIDKELNNIETKSVEPVKEVVVPIINEEPTQTIINEVPVEPSSPKLFSSVYVNREVEMPRMAEPIPVELPKESIPIREEKNATPSIDDLQNIALQNIAKNSATTSFPNLSGETYNINEINEN